MMGVAGDPTSQRRSAASDRPDLRGLSRLLKGGVGYRAERAFINETRRGTGRLGLEPGASAARPLS